MMIRIDFQYLYQRTKEVLLKPHAAWATINKEHNSVQEIFKAYLFPITAIASLVVLLLSFFHYSVIQAILYACINFISVTGGTYFSYLIFREYLNNKVEDSDSTSLKLTVYSSVVFSVFHSLSVAFISGFISQLMGLASLIFIRTLYVGISTTEELQAGQKTNLLIIMTLSIICIPVILKKLLMVLFNIPVFYL